MMHAHELREAGISAQTIARAVESGEVERISRGVYQKRGAEPDPRPSHQLIADSVDTRVGADKGHFAEPAGKQSTGRYFGELDLRFEYKGRSGADFSTLQVDVDMLTRIAGGNGWRCELIKSIGGYYLARLLPA